MKHLIDKMNVVNNKIKLKHLRGQHDQRDHAWNRGMGRGDAGGLGKRGGGAGVELGPNQMGPMPPMQMYQSQRAQLEQQVRDGKMSILEMRNQLRQMRGINTNQFTLANANRNANPYLSPNTSQGFDQSLLIERQRRELEERMRQRGGFVPTYSPPTSTSTPKINDDFLSQNIFIEKLRQEWQAGQGKKPNQQFGSNPQLLEQYLIREYEKRTGKKYIPPMTVEESSRMIDDAIRARDSRATRRPVSKRNPLDDQLRDFTLASIATTPTIELDARMADFERFTPDRPQHSKTLRGLSFMREMADEAVDPKAASALFVETVKKMMDSMTVKDSWNIGGISGEINTLQNQINAISNGPFANMGFAKNQIAALMQRLEAAKIKYQAAKQQQANATLARFAPDNPSSAPKPIYGSGVTPELQAKLEPIFQKFGSIFQNGMLNEQGFGQPLVFRVDYESLGVDGNLAQVDLQLDGIGDPIRVITINSDTIDSASLESSIFHEMAHILQFDQDENVMDPHWDYLQKRVDGQPVMFDQANDIAYTEDTFTRSYEGVINKGQFARGQIQQLKKKALIYGVDDLPLPYEVLSTAIEQFIIDPVGLMYRDPDVFVHVAAFVTGKAATYSKNTYAPIRPARGSAYTPGPGTPGPTPGTPGPTPGPRPTPGTPGPTRTPGPTPGTPGPTPGTPGPTPGTPGPTPGTPGRPPFEYSTDTSHVDSRIPISATSEGDPSILPRYEEIRRNVGGRLVKATGRRKTPYIDEVPKDEWPEELQNNPKVARDIAILQRQYDKELSLLSQLEYPNQAQRLNRLIENDPDVAEVWQETRMRAALIAAQMYDLYPDPNLLRDVLSILPKVDDTVDAKKTESINALKAYAEYYLNPWLPGKTGYAKMPDNIVDFGIPGSTLFPGENLHSVDPRLEPYNQAGSYRHFQKTNPRTLSKYPFIGGSSSALLDSFAEMDLSELLIPKVPSLNEFQGTKNIPLLTSSTTPSTPSTPTPGASTPSTPTPGASTPSTPTPTPTTPSTPTPTPTTPSTPTPTPTTPSTPTPGATTPPVAPTPPKAPAYTPSPDAPPVADINYEDIGKVTGTTFPEATKGLVGKESVAYGTDPTTIYKVRFRVMNKDDIKTSNDTNGNINPDYDQSLQPRARDRIAYSAQVQTMAQRLQPAIMINDTQQSDSGSPVINSDGMVVSGNGRAIALELIDDEVRYPGRKEAYKNHLMRNAASMGLNPDEIAQMENPILVRELAEDAPVGEFVRDANRPRGARYSPIEEARFDSMGINTEILNLFDPGEDENIDEALNAPRNKRFRDAFSATIAPNERAAMLTEDGDLNASGLTRIKSAILLSAFNHDSGDRMVSSLIDTNNVDMKSVQTALAGTLPAISHVATQAQSNVVRPEYNPTELIAQTINTLGKILKSKYYDGTREQKVDTYINQASLWGGEEKPTDIQELLLRHFAKIANKPLKLRWFLNEWMNSILAMPKVGQEDSFSGQNSFITPIQLLQNVIDRDNKKRAEEDALRDLKKNEKKNEGTLFDQKSFDDESDEECGLYDALMYIKMYKQYNRPLTPRRRYFNYVFGVGI